MKYKGWKVFVTENFLKKSPKKEKKRIAIDVTIIYNSYCCLFRDEVVSCRQARRVITTDQPGNRATDSSADRPAPAVGMPMRNENDQGGLSMATQKIRIKLKSYEHNLVDQSATRIVETAKRTGARVSGPIPLPTEREVVTILRATHKYKDSREQFERRTHKRLIDIVNPNPKTVDAMMKLELPAGVEIEMKL